MVCAVWIVCPWFCHHNGPAMKFHLHGHLPKTKTPFFARQKQCVQNKVTTGILYIHIRCSGRICSRTHESRLKRIGRTSKRFQQWQPMSWNAKWPYRRIVTVRFRKRTPFLYRSSCIDIHNITVNSFFNRTSTTLEDTIDESPNCSLTEGSVFCEIKVLIKID